MDFLLITKEVGSITSRQALLDAEYPLFGDFDRPARGATWQWRHVRSNRGLRRRKLFRIGVAVLFIVLLSVVAAVVRLGGGPVNSEKGLLDAVLAVLAWPIELVAF